MKKFVSSTKRKFGFIRLLSITAVVLTAAIFINALPNLSAQAASGGSFFGLAEFFSWNATSQPAVKPQTNDIDAPSAVGSCEALVGGVIEVESAANSTPTGYATLAAAFTAINGGAYTGAVTIDVCGDTTEPAIAASASAILNASGTGSASYTSITISPAGGATRTISGAATAGFPLIDFNGADSVTVNGLDIGGDYLTIANTTVSATSGTSTIRFQTDATGNTITNASVRGSATMAAATNGGNIWFGSAAVTTGNDNNTVSNCNIGPAGANLPTKGIYLSGSSNTDPGTANSGIVITGNNIFDYFSATVASAGIDLNSGSVGTTISNNKFYQTATRAQTIATQHSGIRISNTSGNAYQITGNTVGFASAAGTGTYNFVGIGSASTFVPINLLVGTTTATSVQGNTVAGIAMSGAMSGTSSSAAFRGIYVGNGLTTVGNVTGNTIGSQSATGSITYTSTSTSASDVIGIFNFGSSNFTTNNNTVGGITAGNSSTGAANIYGIRTNTSSAVTWTCLNNTVGGTVANSINSTSTATGTIVQGILNNNPIGTFTGNTIRNLTAAGGTGTTTTASVVGMVMNNSANNTIGTNTIFNLTNINTAAATIVTGIQFNGSGTVNVVERNFIYGLTSATNSATAEVNGIRIGAGTTIYRNNMIAIGAGIANAIGGAATNSSTSGVVGINEALGTNSIFHNSVYIGGSPTAGSGASYAFNGNQTVNTRSFRDNIFFNARSNSGATGKNYAVKINGTTVNPTGLTINNNIYLANGTGGTFGFFNSLDVANLAAWKTVVGQDTGSFEANPQYLDPTNAVPNLHINPAVPSLAEGSGADVGVILDYDGQTRSGLTPVDIGADAGNFMSAGDLSAPVISYTAFGNTTSTGSRTLNVNVTDNVGVTATFIYYKVNAGAYTSAACTFVSGTATNVIVDCTILASVAATDTVSYFVAAQDAAGNIGSNPAGALGASAGTITTFPTTPNTYTIVAGFPASVNVGTGETFTSLTNAGGIFAALNAGVLTGNVVVNITTDLAGETGAVALNQLNEEGANPGTYTVTIKPSGAARAISGTSGASSGIIILNGADRVTIDGSTSGGTDRSLTITNTTTTSVDIWIRSASAANGANNNTVKNCILNGPAAKGIAGILAGGVAFGSAADAPNSNNTVQNNLVTGMQNGLFLSGNATTFDQNWLITGNTFGSATVADKLTFRGMLLGGANNFTITQNTILGVIAPGGSTATGIQLSANATNGSITRNNISDIKNTSASGFGANGIFLLQSSTTANVTVANNFIRDVAGFGFAGVDQADNGYGIVVASGGGYKIHFNSVSLATNQTAAGSITAAVNILAAVTTAGSIDLRDNILANSQTVGTRYAVLNLSTQGAAVFVDSNYNDYFAQNVGRQGAITYPTLLDWKGATGKDVNSVLGDPGFVSATDLHINPIAGLVVSNAGTPIMGITTDIDNETRNVTTPDIGADEFAPPVGAGTVEFGSATFSGNEGTTVMVTVNRVGGNGGAISVNYATSNGTATAGTCGMGSADYQSAAGTLNWANSDAAPKTFNVTLCTDASFSEGSETVLLTLSSPMGTTISGTNPATLTINDVGLVNCNTTPIVIPVSGSATPYPSDITVSGAIGTVASVKVTLNNFSHDYSSDVDILLVGPGGQKYIIMSDTGGISVTTNATIVLADSGAATIPNTAPIASGTYKPTNIGTGDPFAAPAPAGPYQDAAPAGTATFASVFGSTNPNGAWSLYVVDDAGPDPGTISGGWCLELTLDPPAPGTLQFSSATYAANENSTAAITVNRTGGSAGTVTANVTINAASTATGGAACGGGIDYINTGLAQTLTFVDGDISESFNVTLCPDFANDPGETIIFNLTTPTGGATIGAINQATLTITDVPAPLTGTYNVPGDFASLTNTGGIFEALNASGASGAITINIAADLTGETGVVALNQLVGGFAVTIKPTGAARSITGASTTATPRSLIRINGADNVTIDGSISGGTDRSLTITNNDVSTASTVIQVASGATGAQNVTIKNTVVIGSGSLATIGGITFGGAGVASLGLDNDTKRIENCDIRKVQFGIATFGASAANPDTGAVITNNLMNNAAPDNIGKVGIVVGFENGIQITQNTVGEINSSTGAFDVIGISLGGFVGVGNSTTAAGSDVTNANVSRNNIGSIQQTNTYSAFGILVAPAASGTNLIANNIISGVLANGTFSDFGAGIFLIDSGVDSTTQIYHNSVSMSGTATGADERQYALAINGTDPLVDVRNNIFSNTQTTGAANNSYAVGLGYSTFANFTSDFNDLFVTTTGNFRVGRTGNLDDAGTDQATLADWRTATGDDLTSFSADPLFVSATDLHIQTTPLSPVANTGTPIAAVTVDFDNQPRSGTTPDIGADEFVRNATAGDAVTAGTYSDLTTVGGQTLGGNVTILDTLTLGGNLNAGANTLTFDCNATTTNAGGTNFVEGNVAKIFCAVGSFTFPVGTTDGPDDGYTPVTATATAASVFPATLTVDAVDAALPGLLSGQKATRHWLLTETGDLSATLTFNYLENDTLVNTSNTDENDYRVFRDNAGVLENKCPISPCVNVVANTVTTQSPQTDFSAFGIGNTSPTAASVDVGGRIREANGRGIFRARVTMTDSTGNVRMAFTNQFGYFRFISVAAGSTYVFSATHRRYQFTEPTQVQFISEATDGVNFTTSGENPGFRPEATFFDNAPFDFDGDGRTDVSVFRSSDNTWYINRSSDNTLFAQAFGAAGDRLAPADFDGDGKTDLAVFRSSEGNWYIWQSASSSLRVEQFGTELDRAIPADFDGDGKADFSIWNEMRGTWQVKLSTNSTIVSERFTNGKGNFTPLASDRDGDGKADFIFFNSLNATWTIRTSSGANIKEQFGAAGDRAATGDFDGDAQGDLAVYRAEGNVWTIKLADGKELNDLRLSANADNPALGDFDGDGKYDAAGFGGGIWSVRQSVNGTVRQQQFGLADDTIIPSVR